MVAEIPEAKVAELIQLLQEVQKNNVISIKKLRSSTAKVMSVASVLQVWRPFVQQLYTAMHVTETHAQLGAYGQDRLVTLSHGDCFFAGDAGDQARIHLGSIPEVRPSDCHHLGR